MEYQTHVQILKRVGIVLVAVGIIDIGLLIYSIANGTSYTSSLNIIAIIAGIFLIRGSLRAASIVRWLAAFMLAILALLVAALPFMQPIGLTFTQLRLVPGATFAAVLFFAVIIFLLSWLVRALGAEPIQTARAAAGRKRRNMRIPVALGVGLGVVGVVFLVLVLGGESADHAKSIAEQQVGPGYRFHVSSLYIQEGSQGTCFSGVVTAWNDEEIKNVPVQWEEC